VTAPGGVSDLVILFDVDNTLLDNDRVRVELEQRVAAIVGDGLNERFWQIYEEVRADLDHVSFPETIERFSHACEDVGCVEALSELLYSFPFQSCVYPGALDALGHARRLGLPAIVTDGDQFFQRYKVRSAGLAPAVDGRVLIYVHKERETDDLRRHFPARHYVMVDDKGRILSAMKARLGDALTTVHVRQGKYATQPPEVTPDLALESIGAFTALTADDLRSAARAAP
jgi:FMN phosphatase YigB (HAD superfamily)